MLNEKFTEKFIAFINKNFPLDKNYIYIYDGNKGDIKEANVKYTNKLNKDVDLSLLKDNDKLFIHSFYSHKLLKFMVVNKYRIKKEQIVLIIYGADLYNNKLKSINGEKISFKEQFYEFLKRCLVKRAGLFMTYACADYSLAKEWYGACGKQFDCLYPSNIDKEKIDEISSKATANKSQINILLGNSATFTNQHEEALRVLSKFKDENIRIICPLSYGDNGYAKRIQKIGLEIFKSKFIAVLDYMKIDDYVAMLNDCDIAIFNNNRQQATGNIEILGYLGKKVFVRSDTTTWKHYVERDGCRFFDTKKIQKMEFDELIALKEADKDKNRTYFKQIWNEEYIKKLWENVMNYNL